MKYFLIYCYKGTPVDVCSFDDEASQMEQFYNDSHLEDYRQHIRYDSIHILNQVN